MASRWRSRRPEPQPLSRTVSELVALRGYAATQGDSELQSVWARVAGAAVAAQTRAVAIRGGVLHVAVNSAPLLADLAGFHRAELLGRLCKHWGRLKVRDLKFRLDSAVGARHNNSRDRRDQ